jgi:hypothetical protein
MGGYGSMIFGAIVQAGSAILAATGLIHAHSGGPKDEAKVD